MSSTEETPELKAGHPPAVKVGNMRVVQKKDPSSDKPPAEPKPADENEDEEEIEDTEDKVKEKPLTISGAPARGNADFPEQAVKAFHEKPETPQSAYSLRDNSRKTQNIRQVHQPRKNN